jgi:hypothetical protein
VLLGPAHIHAQQHLGPVLRLGAALAGLHLQEAVVAVRLAGKEALELALRRLLAQLGQGRLGLGGDRLIALGVGQLDEADGIVQLALEPAIAVDRTVEAVALAQQPLCLLRVVPEIGILGERVQLLEPPVRLIPVKDASSAAPTRREPRRRPPALQHACCASFPPLIPVKTDASP